MSRANCEPEALFAPKLHVLGALQPRLEVSPTLPLGSYADHDPPVAITLRAFPIIPPPAFAILRRWICQPGCASIAFQLRRWCSTIVAG